MPTLGPANLIKAQILENLQELVASTVLGSIVEKDINANVLDDDLDGYPCAILGTSSMEAEYEFPQSNRRTYIFPLLIVQLQDNLSSMGDMEDLRDAVALQFDNNVTLAGTSELCIRAVFSERITYASKGKNFVLFSVTIKATTLVSLTYSF